MKKLLKTNLLLTFAIIMLFSLTSSISVEAYLPSIQHYRPNDTVVPNAYAVVTCWEPLTFIVALCPSGYVFSCKNDQCVYPDDSDYCNCHY